MSRYNATITNELEQGAVATLRALRGQGAIDMLEIVYAPGAYELPYLVHAAAASGRFAGVLALGCIIKGETIHDRVIADAVAQGLVNVSLMTGVPCALGVLTVNTAAQAKARAGGRMGNKGAEAMEALLFTIHAAELAKNGPGAAQSSGAEVSRPDKAKHRVKGRA